MWWKQRPLVEEGKEEAATADRSEEGKEEKIQREGCQRSQGLSGDLSWIFILHCLVEHIQQSILTVGPGFFPKKTVGPGFSSSDARHAIDSTMFIL